MIFAAPELSQKELDQIKQIEELEANLGYLLGDSRAEWQQLLARNIFARSIQGSILLEGHDVTVDDSVAAAARDEPLDASPEAWDAIMGYRTAMQCAQQLADDPYFHFSGDWIRSLHFMMMQYEEHKKPGRWRAGSSFIRGADRNEVLYEAPDARKIPELMVELTTFLESAAHSEETHPIIIAAMAHLNIAMMHPFSDGNGRVARCLQTLVLARAGAHATEAWSIEEYLGRNMKDYFRTLGEVGGRKWSPAADASPWIRFILTAHVQQARTLLAKAQHYERLWELLEQQARNVALPSRVAFAFVNAAVGHSVRNSTYRSIAGISDQVASRDLALTVKMGLLDAEGDRRGRRYVASADLLAIAARAAQESDAASLT